MGLPGNNPGVLMEWMTNYHSPLQLLAGEDGLWVVVDNSTGIILGSGASVFSALCEAYNKKEEVKCSACGGTDHIRPSSPWHAPHIICNPCLIVWYDMGITDPEQVGAESLRLKAAGKFPWTGKYTP